MSNTQVAAPVSPAFEQLAEWNIFYSIFFGGGKRISSSLAPPCCPGFNQLILLFGEITAYDLVKASSEMFPMAIPPELLEEIKSGIPLERRAKGDYAVWAKNRPEPEWRSTEVRQLILSRLPRISCMTLSERLVFGLFYFWKKRDHIDKQGATLCLPTQCKSGRILEVTCVVTDGKKGIFGFRKKTEKAKETVFISPWKPNSTGEIPSHLGLREVKHMA